MLYLEKIYIINPTHFITSLKYFFSKRLRQEMQRNYQLWLTVVPSTLFVIHWSRENLSFKFILIICRCLNFSQITPQATLELIRHQFFQLGHYYSLLYYMQLLLSFRLRLRYLILLDQGYRWLRYIPFCLICCKIQIFNFYYYFIGFKFSMTMELHLRLLHNYSAAL